MQDRRTICYEALVNLLNDRADDGYIAYVATRPSRHTVKYIAICVDGDDIVEATSREVVLSVSDIVTGRTIEFISCSYVGNLLHSIIIPTDAHGRCAGCRIYFVPRALWNPSVEEKELSLKKVLHFK